MHLRVGGTHLCFSFGCSMVRRSSEPKTILPCWYQYYYRQLPRAKRKRRGGRTTIFAVTKVGLLRSLAPRCRSTGALSRIPHSLLIHLSSKLRRDRESPLLSSASSLEGRERLHIVHVGGACCSTKRVVCLTILPRVNKSEKKNSVKTNSHNSNNSEKNRHGIDSLHHMAISPP